MPKRYLKGSITSCILYLSLASVLGLLMRSAFVIDLPDGFNYVHVKHAHSHVALQGWLFAIFGVGIIHLFKLGFKNFKTVFWALQIAVFCMFISFIWTGYTVTSVSISMIHMLFSYIFIYKIWQRLRHSPSAPLSKRLLKTSLIMLVIATLGTLALGPLVMSGFKGHALYYGAIQFYLHFLFNGFFIFAALAMFFCMLDQKGIEITENQAAPFYYTLLLATIFTFALAITWSTPYPSIFLLNSIGVAIQLIALMLFLILLRKNKHSLKVAFPSLINNILLIALIAFAFKILTQTAVIHPEVAQISYTIRNFIIGFIHLLMLGCLSLFILSVVESIRPGGISRSGIYMFIIGVLLTETLLFYQGLMLWLEKGFIWNYYTLITIASVLMALSTMLILRKWLMNPSHRL